MRLAWLPAALLTAIAGAGFATLVLFHGAKPPRTRVLAAAPPRERTISLTGKIQPQQIVSVPVPPEGIVDAVFVEVGQEVFSGQLLARIRSNRLVTAQAAAQEAADKARDRVRDLETALESARLEVSRSQAASARAQSDFAATEKDYLRQQMLVREGATPRLVFEKAEREYKSARADAESLGALAAQAEDRANSITRELQQTRAALDQRSREASVAHTDSEVQAPVDGVVIARGANAGESIGPARGSLFEIAVNPELLDVVVSPDVSILSRLHPGQAAIVRVAETGDVAIPAEVRAVGGGRALVGFTSPVPAVKPGLTAVVALTETR